MPYRTLGLNPNDVLDAQGNYITYHVNANFARDPLGVQRSRLVPDFQLERGHQPELHEGAVLLLGHDHSKPGDHGAGFQGVSLFPFKRDSANYLSLNTLYLGPALSQASNNITTIIFVLVSHGDTGGGAFLSNGTRSPATANTGTAETENMNGDNTFVWA